MTWRRVATWTECGRCSRRIEPGEFVAILADRFRRCEQCAGVPVDIHTLAAANAARDEPAADDRGQFRLLRDLGSTWNPSRDLREE